jgi:hypothetical protein
MLPQTTKGQNHENATFFEVRAGRVCRGNDDGGADAGIRRRGNEDFRGRLF